MKPSQILHVAGDVLEQPGAWTQGYYARNKKGISTSYVDGDAVCWCAAGMLLKMGGMDGIAEAVDYLCRVAGVIGTGSLADWNDKPERTQEEIIAAFRQAEQLAKDEGQ